MGLVVRQRRFFPLAQACDEVLFDLKIMDEALAREQLRMNMPRVLDNFAFKDTILFSKLR